MNYLKLKLKKVIQNLVDRISGKPIDITVSTMYLLTSIIALFLLINTFRLTGSNPELKYHFPNWMYFILIAIPIIMFYLSMMGKYLKKVSRRVIQFIAAILLTYIFITSYIVQILNSSFIKFILGIKNIEVIPYDMLKGNIRIMTFFIPIFITTPALIILIKSLMKQDVRKKLAEYEVEELLPTVFPSDESTVDIKLCENIMNSEPCILPEKKTFEHIWLQGGSGSGKTATALKPFIDQIYYKKRYLQEKEKEIVFKALEDGIVYITIPVTKKWFNENFSMKYIKPKDGKQDEFVKRLGKYCIGVRNKEIQILNESFKDKKDIEIAALKGDDHYEIQIDILYYGQEYYTKNEKITCNDKSFKIELEDFGTVYGMEIEKNEKTTKDDDENNFKEYQNLNKDITEEMNVKIKLIFDGLDEGYSYNLKVTLKGSSKIITKDVGLTVIAPDGGLPQDAINIAAEYGIKVKKIDPDMDEIRKGGIAKFNPLKGSFPEKTADIVSSILVSMTQSEGGDKSNPYFVQASVRAVRNLIVLLKVMFPITHKCDPTLIDVLDMLNDFNKVETYVEDMKKIKELRARWKSVIDYFEVNFYSPELNEKGNIVIGSSRGSQRKKTEEAIQGIINQLDNFLGREEIRYILCDRENSIDLKEVLEDGENLAIATRTSSLGPILSKAFALFFILSIQTEVLSRYSENENPEIPYHIYIDEFPFYVNDNTKTFFTFSRKYRCSVLIAIQNISQLEEVSKNFGQTLFTNTDTKILLPKSNLEDRKYWATFFGMEEKFDIETGVSINPVSSDKPSLSENKRGSIQNQSRVSEDDIMNLQFKQAFVAYTNSKNRYKIVKGETDFIQKRKEKIEIKYYDFDKFSLDAALYNEKLKKEQEQSNLNKVYYNETKAELKSGSDFQEEMTNEEFSDFSETEEVVDINIQMVSIDGCTEDEEKTDGNNGFLEEGDDKTKDIGFRIEDKEEEMV